MITILTLFASVVPGLLICYFIFQQDKHEKEPLPLLAICFGLGIAIFYAARIGEGFMDDLITPFVTRNEIDPETHFGVLFYAAFIRTALVEELLKLTILLAIPFNHKEFNEPMDGIVYAVMIGMGFAIVENIIYCMPDDIALAVLRDFTAVPAHAIFGVILGYYVGLAKFDRAHLFKNILLGLFLAVTVHGLYDFFLFQRYDDWLMILATIVLLGGFFFSRKFINRHQEYSPFKNQPASIPPLPEDEAILDSAIVLEQKDQPSEMKIEDNEILSAVLFEMKEKQDLEKGKKDEEE